VRKSGLRVTANRDIGKYPLHKIYTKVTYKALTKSPQKLFVMRDLPLYAFFKSTHLKNGIAQKSKGHVRRAPYFNEPKTIIFTRDIKKTYSYFEATRAPIFVKNGYFWILRGGVRVKIRKSTGRSAQ
jgi:hypothetical protein